MDGTRSRTDELPLPELVRRLKHPDTADRRAAAAALGRLGPKAGPAVPALAEALSDEDLYVRRLAALALGDIGAGGAVPALIEALGDEDEGARRRAAVALGEIGPEAAPALAALRELREEGGEAVREAAARAVRDIKRA